VLSLAAAEPAWSGSNSAAPLTPPQSVPFTPSTNQVNFLNQATCAQQLNDSINTANITALSLNEAGAVTGAVFPNAGFAAQIPGFAAAVSAEALTAGVTNVLSPNFPTILPSEAPMLPNCDATFAGTVQIGGPNAAIPSGDTALDVTGPSIFNGNATVTNTLSANQIQASQGISADGGAITLGDPNLTTYSSGITIGGGAISGAGHGGAAASTGDVTAIAIGDGSQATQVDSMALGENAAATGGSSIALGNGAQAISTYAIAEGTSAMANGTNAIAIGNGAQAISTYAIAEGAGAQANGTEAIALGNGAQAINTYAIAEGAGAQANGSKAIAIGNGAQASNTYAIAEGAGAQANGINAIALGNGAQASNTSAIAEGAGAQANGINSIAIGNGAVSATNSVVMGPGATDNGFMNASVYGANAQVGAAGNIAFGNGANASGTTSIAIGEMSLASGNASTAVGQSATVLATNGTAIGQGSIVQSAATNSVAIGQGSIATDPNTVSVGSLGDDRRIANVAPGIFPTDAVNVEQLVSVAAGLQSQINRADSGVAMSMAMAGGFLPDNKQFALAANYGAFGGESGLALTGLYRVTGNVVISGSAGYGVGPDAGQFGGRIGMQYAW
jgi:hypothetical protein